MWCLFMLFGDCCFACFGCLDVVVFDIVVVCVVLVCMVDLLFVDCLVVCLFCLVWLAVLGGAVCCRFGSSRLLLCGCWGCWCLLASCCDCQVFVVLVLLDSHWFYEPCWLIVLI